MNYRIRRNLKHLSVYTVAKNLGVDYNKYVQVERGERSLEKEYVDKFQKIMDNATSIKLERSMKMARIRPLFANGVLKEKVKEYGYTHSELGEALGLTQGTISNAFSGNLKITSDDTMERIYDFLNEPFNKKVSATINQGKRGKYCSPEVEKWFRENNLEELIANSEYTRAKLAKKVGVTESHITNVIKGNRNPSGNLKTALYEVFNSKEKKDEQISLDIPVDKSTNVITNKDANVISSSVFDAVKLDNSNIACYVDTDNGFEPLNEDNDIETKPTLEEQIDALLKENNRLKDQIDAYVKLIGRL